LILFQRPKGNSSERANARAFVLLGGDLGSRANAGATIGDLGRDMGVDFLGHPANTALADMHSTREFAFGFETIYVAAAKRNTAFAQFRKQKQFARH
jgi:hypothetical protein